MEEVFSKVMEYGPQAIDYALKYGPQAIAAGTAAYNVGKKYVPSMFRGVKKLANNIFSAKKRRSAKEYIKGLSKPKGWAKLAQDSVKTAKGASDLISSGKLMKGVSEVAGDVGNVVNLSKGLIGDKYHSKATEFLDKGVGQAQHFHDIANNYNEQGKQLANQFQKQIGAVGL